MPGFAALNRPQACKIGVRITSSARFAKPVYVRINCISDTLYESAKKTGGKYLLKKLTGELNKSFILAGPKKKVHCRNS